MPGRLRNYELRLLNGLRLAHSARVTIRFEIKFIAGEAYKVLFTHYPIRRLRKLRV
jgi:hypothetical protein